uniref:Acyltransferase n=1 Tax=Chromochloris zofingiensis TaxID=31302 RepID=A0A411PNG1_9CHLO|nr:diacylglycerol acyltransferase [Chromochloris zofingiensis]|eukprot:jgi/Chrzof1/2667/Cz11g24150.t1_DGAT2C[v5.2]
MKDAVAAAALGCFVGAILLSTVLQLLAGAAVFLFPASIWTWMYVAFLAYLAFSPLGSTPTWAQAFIRFSCAASKDYFPTKVIVEDESTLQRDKAYVIGLEPHSSLPVAVPAVFGSESPLLPAALRGNCHGLASSVCFQFPLVRHLWWWLGLRPIDRHSMAALLRHGKSVVLVPGGVQECLYMQPGSELAFLRNRKGFVRMAMRHGAPIIPVFAFGQSNTFQWYRPGPPWVSEAFVAKLSRRIGMVPLLIMGRWGTPLPIQTPMTVVFGKPIPVPHTETPSDELVQEHLDKFITAMETLFHKYKAQAGFPDMQLFIR